MKKAFLWLCAVLMGATAAFNLLGGLGTTCVALFAERFGERMAALVPYKPLYWLFVAAGVATAAWEAYAVSGIMRRTPAALRQCALSLAAGALAAGAQAFASTALRGSGAPSDMRLYLTLATLVLVALAGAAGVFGRSGDDETSPDEPGDGRAATGAALIAGGALALAAPALVRSTHVLAGVDYSVAFGIVLPAAGAAAVLAGAGFTALSHLGYSPRRMNGR
ncbi:MAG: hypothetical protein FDZ70_08700 [Actinobacteria bacterium]|nr:MAG: hypothetical protein FDZ70_08700 [Actinomycetota bacterium]